MAQETEFLRRLDATLASIDDREPDAQFDGSAFSQSLDKTLARIKKLEEPPKEEPGFFGGVTENLGSEIALATEKSARGLLAGAAGSVAVPEVSSRDRQFIEELGGSADNKTLFPGRTMLEGTMVGRAASAVEEANLNRAREIDREIQANRPEDLSIAQEGVRAGAVSLAQNLPPLIAALATRSPTVATVGASTLVAGDSYATARNEGLTHEDSAQYAKVDALIEAATEVIPNQILVDAVGGAAGGTLVDSIKRFTKGEILGEQAATFLQTLNAYYNGLDPELDDALNNGDIMRAAQIQGERQVITGIATIVAGGAQVGAASAARGLMGSAPEQTESQEMQEARETPLDGTPSRGEGGLTPKQQENLRRLRKLQEMDLAPPGQQKVLITTGGEAVAAPEAPEMAIRETVEQVDADAPLAPAPSAPPASLSAQSEQALEIIRASESPTISDVQRGLQIGFNPTKNVLNDLANQGLIDPNFDGGIKLISTSPTTPTVAPILTGVPARIRNSKAQEVEAEWAVVDVNSLIASNRFDGGVNPNYPSELQPRNRERMASQQQIREIAATLVPEQLGDTGRAEDGAPIVGPDLVVESGNGRTAALQLAYQQGKADEYASWVRDQARQRGVSDEQLSSIENPVLVRRRTRELSLEDRRAFTRDANVSSIARLSAAEQARADAAGMSDDVLARFVPGENGDVANSANESAVIRFIESFPTSERGSMMTEGTKDRRPTPSKEGYTRFRNALFARAYGDPRLIDAFTEQESSTIKNVRNALSSVAAKFAQARSSAAEDSTLASDVIDQIVGAVELIQTARSENRSIDDLAAQTDMLGGGTDPIAVEIARVFDDNKRSFKSTRDFLNGIGDYLTTAAQSTQSAGLFGDELDTPTVDGIVASAVENFKRLNDAGQPQDLFAQPAPAANVLQDDGGSGARSESQEPGPAPDPAIEDGDRVPGAGPSDQTLFKRIDFEQSPGSFRYSGRLTSIPKIGFIRAASVGTPNSVVYSQTDDVISNGYRGNQVPSFARNELAAAMEDLSELGITPELIGNLAQTGIVSFDTTDGTVGYFDYQAGVVGINSQLFADLASDTSGDRSAYKQNLRRVLRSTLAHEVGHAVDFNMAQGRGLAARMVQSSFGFQAQQQNGELIVDGKPLFNEAAEQWRGGELSEYFTYPLNLIDGMLKDGGGQVSQEDQVLIARELFAQSYALYYTDREALQRNMPQTFAVIQDAAETAYQRFNGGRNGVQLDSNRRRESTPAGDGFVRSEVRTPGPVGRDQDGGAQRNDQSPNRQDQLFYQGREAESALGGDQGQAIPRESSELNEAPDPIQDSLEFRPYGSAIDSGGMLSNREPSNLYNLDDETKIQKSIRLYQDKMIRLRVQLEKIKDVAGIDRLPESLDVAMKETLYTGKVAEDFRQIEKKAEGIIPILKDASLSVEELGLFMYAMHAPERNNFIAEKRRAAIKRFQDAAAEGRSLQGSPPDPMEDGGSGMTNQEADQILLRFEQEGKTAELRQASNVIYGLLQDARDRLKQEGMIDEETQAVWESSFEFYVPLKGFAEEQQTPVVGRSMTGSGFSIGGNETMAAIGRRTQAANPVLNAFALAQEKAMRIRKNEVAVSMLDLALEFPDSSSWKVYRDGNGPLEEMPGPNGGIVRQRVNMRTARRMDDGSKRFFMAKVDGETYFIEIKDELLNRALQNSGIEQAGAASEFLANTVGKFTRGLSQLSTTYNPSFFLVNAPRDLTTGVYNALAEQEMAGGRIEGKKVAQAIPKNWVASGRAFWRNARGKSGTTPEQILFDRYAQEFRESGALTGWANILDLEQEAKRINSLANVNGKTGMADAKRSFRKLGDLIQDFNGSFENAARLSAYVAARQQGVSAERAADLAKNLTVNFNRRGENTTAMNSLYMFFNAAVQGNANIIRSLSGKRRGGGATMAQRLAIASIGVATGLAVMNRMISGEDDEGNLHYDLIPQYEKDRNIIIMNPLDGETYFKIPLPYGYSVLHVLGTEMTDAMLSPRKSALDAATHVIGALSGSFSPLSISASEDVAKSVGKTLSPTIIQPFVEAFVINENHWGSTIVPEKFPNQQHLPDSLIHKPSTSELAVAFAQWLNEATGGKKYIPSPLGITDISPDALDHLVGFYSGGAGRFTMRAIDFGVTAAQGKTDNMELRELPLVRLVSGQPSKYEHLDTFYTNLIKIKGIVEQRDSYTGAERLEYTRENARILGLVGAMESAEKQLRVIRKAKRNAEKYMSEDRLEAYQEQKLEQEYKVYRRFNARFARATAED